MKTYIDTSNIADVRVLVCGSRNADIDIEIVDSCISDIIADFDTDDIEFISGAARGGDKLGEEFAKRHGYRVVQFRPDWAQYGRAAGPIRNTQMVDYIEESETPIVIAFWDGKSKGTRNTIKTAQSRHIPVHIIRYNDYEESISAGIQLKDNKVVYDWGDDEPEDILPLANRKISQSTRSGHRFFFSFKANKSHEDWNRFLDILKHDTDASTLKELTDSMVNELYARFNDFDMVIYPKSSSILNDAIIDSIHTIDEYIPVYSVSKTDVEGIKFDWDKFKEKYNGDESSFAKTQTSINKMMDRVHKNDRFSMQRQILPRYRKYVINFLELSDLDDALEDIINSRSILVLDDLITTGSTVFEIINMLESIGFEGDIVIYSLINNR